jgi:putative oxidoreductase
MGTIFIIGRTIFGLYWLYNAYNHFVNHRNMTGYAASKGVPVAGTAVLGSGLLLLIGGLSVLFNVREKIGLIALVIFLIPTTLMMHNFWKETDPQMRAMQKVQFGKNAALLGAVLMLWGLPW